jgi:hypothetical protein
MLDVVLMPQARILVRAQCCRMRTWPCGLPACTTATLGSACNAPQVVSLQPRLAQALEEAQQLVAAVGPDAGEPPGPGSGGGTHIPTAAGAGAGAAPPPAPAPAAAPAHPGSPPPPMPQAGQDAPLVGVFCDASLEYMLLVLACLACGCGARLACAACLAWSGRPRHLHGPGCHTCTFLPMHALRHMGSCLGAGARRAAALGLGPGRCPD